MDVVGGAGDDDGLGAEIDGDGGGGGVGSIGGAAGEGLGEDGGDVGDLGGAGLEDAGELDGGGAIGELGVGTGGGSEATGDGGLVDAGDEGLDLVELAWEGCGDDEAVLGGVGDDAGLGGGGGGGLVGGGDAGDCLTDDVGELLGLDGGGVVDADVPAGSVLLLEAVDELLGEGEAFLGPEEDEGARGLIIDGGEVVVGVRGEDLEGLGVGVVGGALGAVAMPKVRLRRSEMMEPEALRRVKVRIWRSAGVEASRVARRARTRWMLERRSVMTMRRLRPRGATEPALESMGVMDSETSRGSRPWRSRTTETTSPGRTSGAGSEPRRMGMGRERMSLKGTRRSCWPASRSMTPFMERMRLRVSRASGNE